MAEELWTANPPPAWEKAVMAVISKLRAALRRVGLGDELGVPQSPETDAVYTAILQA